MTTFNAAFWKWFGKSKVVDAKGKPLVVYHGTNAKFSVFDLGKAASSTFSRPALGELYFFTPNKKRAAYYATARGEHGAKIMAVYLRIRNPLVLKMSDANPGDVTGAIQDALARGKDGLVLLDRTAGEPYPVDSYSYRMFGPGYYQEPVDNSTYIVFSPTQVKSATANRGTWSPSDPDIRHNPDKPRVVCAGLVVIEYFDGQFHIMLPTGTVWMRPTAKQAEAFAKKWAKAHMQKGAVNVLRIDWRGEAAGLARKAGIQG